MSEDKLESVFGISPDALKRIAEEEKRPMYHLVYYDAKGNKFERQVKIRKARCCVSFNGICDDIKEYKLISLGNGEHYWDEIIGHYPYPNGSEFVNDISGRNHLGYQTSITAEEMNKIIEYFKDKW